MGSYATLKRGIEQFIEAGWISAPATPRTPIAYANRDFNPSGSTAWIRVQIAEADNARYTINGAGGDTGTRQVGTIFIQIFVRRGVGVGPAETFCDHAKTLLSEQRIPLSDSTKVILGVGQRREIAMREDDPWQQINYFVPFEHYD